VFHGVIPNMRSYDVHHKQNVWSWLQCDLCRPLSIALSSAYSQSVVFLGPLDPEEEEGTASFLAKYLPKDTASHPRELQSPTLCYVCTYPVSAVSFLSVLGVL